MPPRPRSLPWPAAAVLVLAVPGRAQEEERHGLLGRLEGTDRKDAWLDVPFTTDGWWGLGDRLEELGVMLSISLVTDTSWPLTGGIRERRTDRALFDAAVEVDLDRAAGLSDTVAFAEFYSHAGRDASEDVGDIQAFSNIDEDHVAQLAELWLEHATGDGAVRAKLGKLDANSEFAYVEAGLGFLHSSAGYSPTIFVFPTYPDPAVSANLFVRPYTGWQVGFGVYDANEGGPASGRRGLTADFDAAFLVGQLTRRWGGLGGIAEGRAAIGLWRHTGDLPRFDGGTDSGVGGAYALLEQVLWHERGDGGQGLVGFLQWGAADGDVSEFERHLGAGLVYRGLVPGRDAWQTGLYASHVDLTDEPGAGLGGTELAIELFQEVVLTPSVVLKPDLQLILDPSGRDDVDDAWVATLRVELFF